MDIGRPSDNRVGISITTESRPLRNRHFLMITPTRVGIRISFANASGSPAPRRRKISPINKQSKTIRLARQW
ncbi:hypothetical protein J6590_032817 [Homalodisca vitripennis]|nr:hypothetical protein J6590_032817 [Homalodisca vitripennis]